MARPTQVTFVSGGTEANNSAVWSALAAARARGITYTEMEVVTTAIEHPSLSSPLSWFAEQGVTVLQVAVTETGEIDLPHLRSLLSARTVLVACAYINSEVGTIQPVRAIGSCIREAMRAHGTDVWFHLDGAQAPYWVSCQWSSLGVDSLALDGGKCGGPIGSGVLVMGRERVAHSPLFGGGQERGARPGTEAVVQIVGAAAALAAAQADWRTRAERVAAVRDAGIAALCAAVPEAHLNGAIGVVRVANNINLSVQGIDTEYAVVALDAAGFAVSTKSACAGAGGGASGVVLALTGDATRARSTLRITLGPDTIVTDLERLAEALATHCARMRSLT
jgi:cysteine desulfurase